MASKCTIAVFLVLAVVAASLRPSSAARVLAEEAAPQPPAFWRPPGAAPTAPGAAMHPGPAAPMVPAPCNGSATPTPASPLPPSPPQPAECHTSLSGLAPCAGFLTANATDLSPPPAACCDGVKALVQDAPVCLCHVMNGDLAKILPAQPMRLMRAVALPRVCGVQIPFGTLRNCIRGPVPPMDAPAPPS